MFNNMNTEAVESRNQLVEVWSRLVEDRGGEVAERDGMCTLWADSTFGFWNAVTLLGDDLSALPRAAEFMRSRSEHGFVWLFEDLHDSTDLHDSADLHRHLEAAGLELAFTGYGMSGDVAVADAHHPELEFRRVRTEQELLDYGWINAQAYGMTDQAARDALTGSKLWANDAYAYVGYRDGKPVTAAATIAGPESVFLALVATLPDQMRRGYGEAVTRKAIHEGQKDSGHDRVVLHATEAGRPVYERIGCTANTPIRFLALKEPALMEPALKE